MRTLLGIYLFFLAIYLATCSGHINVSDEVAVYLTTQSIVERHSLAIERVLDTLPGKDGAYYARYQPAQAVLSIPLYVLGRFVEHAFPGLHTYLAIPDYGAAGGTVPIFFVSLFNQFITPLVCVLFYLFCLRLGAGRNRALLATALYGLATPAWVYARTYFQHPLETLALLAALYVLVARRDDVRVQQSLLAGVAFALGAATRINVLLVAPVFVLYLLWAARNGQSSAGDVQAYLWRAGRLLLAFLAPVGVVLGIILLHNVMRFGSPSFGIAMDFSTPVGVGLFGYLLSPGRSIFLYAPPVILGLLAWPRFVHAYRAEALLMASIIAIYLVTYSTYAIWYGGWSFGPRYLLAVIPFLLLPVIFLPATKPLLALAAGLVAAGVGVQLLGVTVNFVCIHNKWVAMQLSPLDSYLFVGGISAIPMHIQALQNRWCLDLWLRWLSRQFGAEVYLLFALLLLLALVGVRLATSDRAERRRA